jgi:hypothetical protein
MVFETQFKRDSPPGSVNEGMEKYDYMHRSGNNCIHTVHTSTTYGSGNRSEGSCEEGNSMKKSSTAKPGFSSKHELDAGLDAMFEIAASENEKKQDPAASDEIVDIADPDDEAELQLVRHLMEPLNKKYLDASGHGERSKNKKKGRKKRGASLERMIAKMILQSSQPAHEVPTPAKTERSAGDNVTTKDILSDLVKAADEPSILSGHSKDTTPWANSSRGANAHVLQEQPQIADSASMDPVEEVAAEDETEQQEAGQKHEQNQEQPSQAHAKDLFGFTADDGWMAFDDFPAFDTSLFPSDALDENGFPMSSEKVPVERRFGPVDLDDDSVAEEQEELAAELRKEMVEEIAKESKNGHVKMKNINSSTRKKVREERSASVAGQVKSSENNSEEEDRLRLIEEEVERKQTEERARKQRLEERMREEQYRQSRKIAKSREEEREKQEQDMAKELARRIAKEQEWGKLHEMAQELARKQLDGENCQNFESRLKLGDYGDRRPFTLEEVEVAERDCFSDDDVSSLPTTQSMDSRSLSQFLIKENNTPPVIDKIGHGSFTSHPVKSASQPVQSSTSVVSGTNQESDVAEQPTDEPSSPSSVVDLNDNPTQKSPAGISGPLAARARYRNTRAVFANRQQTESSPTSRPKPTWNPKPPRHCHRSENAL